MSSPPPEHRPGVRTLNFLPGPGPEANPIGDLQDEVEKLRPLPSGTIVVRGGEKSAPLPPERAFDGTPDPELARMVEAGAKRYHLDTLERLEIESRRKADVVPERRASLRPVSVLGLGAMLAAVGISGSEDDEELYEGTSSGVAIGKLDEIERVRLENLGRAMARSAIGNEDVSAEDGEKLDAVLEKPCGGAACRTLKDCLCDCKRCRIACSRRRR